MVHMDVTMDDGGVDVDVYGVGYTSAQVKSAIAGATITPAQVGTASNPVDETHAEVSSVGELSSTFPGGTVTKTALVKLTDTDNSTPLSLDTGQLTHYDKLHVEGQVNGFGSGGTGFVTLRHNGKATSNTDYGYSYIASGTVSEATSESGFKEEFPNQYGISIDWDLQGSLSGQFTNRGFNIASNTTNYSGNQKILSGQDGTGSALPVDSLQISTPFNATAKIGVWGISY